MGVLAGDTVSDLFRIQGTLNQHGCHWLYNMILLPSNAHSDVINQHCRALPVLCRTLIVLLLMKSGNVHVHLGPSTVSSTNSDLCSD